MISCGKCGRTLTSPKSIQRGVGSSCAKNMGALIKAMAVSSERSERQEAEVAMFLGDEVVAFHQEFLNDKGQLIGDVDVATKETIIEVTNAKNGKLRQLRKYRMNRTINPEGKSVVLYAPNYRFFAQKDVISEGFRWVGTKETLRYALDKIKDGRDKNMEQALILTARQIDNDEFRELMEAFGGENLGDDEFSFDENGAKFTIVLDSHAVRGEKDDDTIKSKLEGGPASCLNIQCGHGVSVEQMRSFIVRVVHQVNGVVEIDDLGVFNLEDIEKNQF